MGSGPPHERRSLRHLYRDPTRACGGPPLLDPGTVVVLDNLSTHKNPRAAAALKKRGCWFLFLPPYSPDLNPIEMAFSKLKTHLRRIGART